MKMDFVELALKRNRGWPWPEHSFGLSSMFGEDGWCHSCGIPLREQSGVLTLQTKGMSDARGAWVPYWRYDAICVSEDLASKITEGFSAELRPGLPRVAVTGWFRRRVPSEGS